MVGAYQFFYILAGCLSTLTIGSIATKYNVMNNGHAMGQILAGSHLIAYTGAIFCFWMAGRHYTQMRTGNPFSLWMQKGEEINVR